MSIYTSHEISACVATQLTPELYRSWGRTLGCQIAPSEKFVVGGDVRRETPDFKAAFCEGLASTGADAVDLGIAPTPMVYYAARRLGAAGCGMITTSYGSAIQNGLKWRIRGKVPSEEDVARLARDTENPSSPPQGRTATSPRFLEICFDYVGFLQETWVDSQATDCRVVLDPMFGCNAARARRYLQAVFPRSLFWAIHDRPDPTFGDRTPDCTLAENVEELSRTVEQERAHLGIVFDADGDRICVVDNEGVTLTAEELTHVLLASFGPELTGQPFVYDLKFSRHMAAAATALGSRAVMERSSYAALHARVRETGALFGAGVRGHYFFGALEGDDDALFAACRLIAHLGRCGQSLAELRRACPKIYMTPDLRIPCLPRQLDQRLELVRAAWADYPQLPLDGVRVEFPDGWALVRPSVNGPALTFRFESGSWSDLQKLVLRFADPLGDLGDSLWAAYEQVMGASCHLD